jgi:hypothetical protein
MFQTNVVEKIKKHLVFNNFFSKIVPFMRQCKKVKVKVKQSRYRPGVAQRVP